MPTPLTPAHRLWRMKIFGATWLSYVGYYFCRKPFSAAKSAIQDETGWNASTLANLWAAYLIAYSLGQFLASAMGPKIGPRKNLLLGMGVSVLVTLAMGVELDVNVFAGLLVVNGFAQATGWSGNVGTMAAWFHKHERGRVMGVWSTNFTVGSIVSGLVMSWVLSQHVAPKKFFGVVLSRGTPPPWRWCFYTGAMVLGFVWLIFFLFQRNNPEDVGLPAIDDPVTPVDESKQPDPPPGDGFLGFTRSQWANLLLIGGFYFCAKFLRYAIWSWSAYFLKKNYALDDAGANFYSIAFDLFGVPGVFLTGYVSDKYFASKRAEVAMIMIVGMVISTGLLTAYGDTSVTVFVILLAAVGFTLFGPDALLSGAGAMDIGSRHLATRATGIIAGFGAMGAVVQEVVIGRMYDQKHGDLGPIFALLFGGAAMAGVFCGALVWRNRRGGNGI